MANSVIYVLTFKLTNIFSKEACFGRRQSPPQPELVGFAAIILLWHDKREAYFAKVQMYIEMRIVENNDTTPH